MNFNIKFYSYMQSVKGTTRIINFKKTETTRHYSQHHIPSQQQATSRQSELKKFHMRKTHIKRRSLQGICRENYRLYFCINQQKSSYQDLFAEKHKKKSNTKDSARYSKVLSELPHQQQVIHFKQQLGKIAKLKQLLSGKQNICERKKKQYPKCFRANNQSFTTNIQKSFRNQQTENWL